jgi:HEAT repeat protein
MGTQAREAVPALVELLQAGAAQDRKLAALALGYLGQAAADAVPALRLAVRDADEGVRKMARVALDRIGPPTVRAEAA